MRGGYYQTPDGVDSLNNLQVRNRVLMNRLQTEVTFYYSRHLSLTLIEQVTIYG